VSWVEDGMFLRKIFCCKYWDGGVGNRIKVDKGVGIGIGIGFETVWDKGIAGLLFIADRLVVPGISIIELTFGAMILFDPDCGLGEQLECATLGLKSLVLTDLDRKPVLVRFLLGEVIGWYWLSKGTSELILVDDEESLLLRSKIDDRCDGDCSNTFRRVCSIRWSWIRCRMNKPVKRSVGTTSSVPFVSKRSARDCARSW